MKSNFKFFACVVLFVFLSVFAGGCGGGDSYSTNGENPTTLDDVFNEDATVKVGFTFFGEEAYATFKHEGDKYSLVEKNGNFADNFTNANAWREENNFIVQIYLVPGWNLAMASDTSLPTDDVWEIEFSSENNTYKDRVRTGVFANNFEDFQVNSVIIDEVEIIDKLESLPYEEPIEEPEAPSNDDSINGGNNGGSGGGSGGGSTPAPMPSTVITLNSTDIALNVGQFATLVATVTPTATVTWSTSSADIASVDQSGKVTGKAMGTATITATAGGKSASCNVTVVEPGSYLEYDESTNKFSMKKKNASEYTVVTSGMTSWSTGWYVVSGEVTITQRISVTGTVDLILRNGSKLNANAGINVADGNKLNIYAQSNTAGAGSISATATDYNYSGIGSGSGNGQNSGTITIHGGSVTATGANNGAGIGGKNNGSGGNITINGGTVTATGGNYAAGIGGGNNGAGGNITINGGNFTATGGTQAAGIGGGYNGAGGNITINGGNFTATGGNFYDKVGMGIGAGYSDDSMNNGTLTVSAGLTVSYSDDGTNYSNYTGSDYSTRHQYMKVEPSDGTRQH